MRVGKLVIAYKQITILNRSIRTYLFAELFHFVHVDLIPRRYKSPVLRAIAVLTGNGQTVKPACRSVESVKRINVAAATLNSLAKRAKAQGYGAFMFFNLRRSSNVNPLNGFNATASEFSVAALGAEPRFVDTGDQRVLSTRPDVMKLEPK